MRNLRSLMLLLACLFQVALAHAQDFGWFSQVVGACWKGTFPDGTTSHRHCYSRQFETFIRGTSELHALREGKQLTVFQGDSLFAWNASSGTIQYYVWGTDGNHRQLSAQYEKDELHFPVPSRQDPSKMAFRSVWRRLNESSFEVRRERPSGDGWSVDLRVVYRREV